ncbi:MAG: RHS repeat-associated core domain-containing protein [Acidobacteriota bacterium]
MQGTTTNLNGGGTGTVTPTYSSDGVLMALARQETTSGPVEDVSIFYFGSRPVAVLREVSGGQDWSYYSTDHLGAPLLVTDDVGNVSWEGPFEPFGEDPSVTAALDADVFLRFPGQWTDSLWQDSMSGADVYYNLNRWYESQGGRYAQADLRPRSFNARESVYLYVLANPLGGTDVLGLKEDGFPFGGSVTNNTPCCLLVSQGRKDGKGQQQQWVPPFTRVNGLGFNTPTDIDAIYAPDGTAVKIPDTASPNITRCITTAADIQPRLFSNKLLGRIWHKLDFEYLPDGPAQREQFGGPILSPEGTCSDSPNVNGPVFPIPGPPLGWYP